MAREVDRHSPLPLWAQVRDDVVRRIQRGDFDTEFPGEHQLVAEYDVSRHTIREALRELRKSGVIEGGRGRQTRVAGNEITQNQGTLYSLFAAAESAGHSQRSVVRVLDARADGVVASQLGLEESTPLVYLERVRLLDGEPFAVDRVWLPARIAAPLLEADFTNTSLYAELDRLCGIRLTGGREQVRAVVPGLGERRLLGIADDVAALHLERVGELRGRPVEWRQTLVRGDRFSFSTDLSSPEPMTVTAHRLNSGATR